MIDLYTRMLNLQLTFYESLKNTVTLTNAIDDSKR